MGCGSVLIIGYSRPVLTSTEGWAAILSNSFEKPSSWTPLTDYLLFCPPQTDQSLILPKIRSARNVSIVTVEMSDDRRLGNANQPEKILRFAEEYQAWIYRQQIDLYHATTPFLWNDTILPHFDVCPMVVTVYDAIPLIFSGQYFTQQNPLARYTNEQRSLFAVAGGLSLFLARPVKTRFATLACRLTDLALPTPLRILALKSSRLTRRPFGYGICALALRCPTNLYWL